MDIKKIIVFFNWWLELMVDFIWMGIIICIICLVVWWELIWFRVVVDIVF